MRIYFAEADMSDDEFEYHLEGAFKYRGKYYWNYVEFGTNAAGTEEFVIHDGCERLMPLCVDKIDDLIDVLEQVRNLHEAMIKGEQTREMVESDAEHAIYS
jgi:hypothetical protein